MNKETFIAIGLVMCTVAVVFAAAVAPPPTSKEPSQYQLACLDAAGQPAVLSPKLQSYCYDTNSVRGQDANGTQYLYTPPQGWLCIISEVK